MSRLARAARARAPRVSQRPRRGRMRRAECASEPHKGRFDWSNARRGRRATRSPPQWRKCTRCAGSGPRLSASGGRSDYRTCEQAQCHFKTGDAGLLEGHPSTIFIVNKGGPERPCALQRVPRERLIRRAFRGAGGSRRQPRLLDGEL